MIKKSILSFLLLLSSLYSQDKSHTEFANSILDKIPYNWEFYKTSCSDMEKKLKFSGYTSSNIYEIFEGNEIIDKAFCNADTGMFAGIRYTSTKGLRQFRPFRKKAEKHTVLRELRKYYKLSQITIDKDKSYQVPLKNNLVLWMDISKNSLNTILIIEKEGVGK
jgi:hypothetical protein